MKILSFRQCGNLVYTTVADAWVAVDAGLAKHGREGGTILLEPGLATEGMEDVKHPLHPDEIIATIVEVSPADKS